MGAKDPFVLPLSVLEEGESHRELIGTPADLDLDPEVFDPNGRVSFRPTVYKMGAKLEIRGPLVARARLKCGRCLKEFEAPVETEFRVFAEPPDSRDPRGNKEVREDDLGIVYHDGQSVDLTEDIRQVLVIEVPWHPVCRPDCQGLCPRCGADRNEEDACTCPRDRVDPRWQALMDHKAPESKTPESKASESIDSKSEDSEPE